MWVLTTFDAGVAASQPRADGGDNVGGNATHEASSTTADSERRRWRRQLSPLVTAGGLVGDRSAFRGLFYKGCVRDCFPNCATKRRSTNEGLR